MKFTECTHLEQLKHAEFVLFYLLYHSLQ